MARPFIHYHIFTDKTPGFKTATYVIFAV